MKDDILTIMISIESENLIHKCSLGRNGYLCKFGYGSLQLFYRDAAKSEIQERKRFLGTNK